MKDAKVLYDPAMAIRDQHEADSYFDALVTYRVENDRVERSEAEAIERQNLGYWAGYFDHDTRRRVEKLFCCEHPFLGSIEKNGPPTFEQALQAGLAMGKRRAAGLRGAKAHATSCPECGNAVDCGASALGDAKQPCPGDISICSNCGAISVFTPMLEVRAITVAERAHLPQAVFDEVAQIVARGKLS